MTIVHWWLLVFGPLLVWQVRELLSADRRRQRILRNPAAGVEDCFTVVTYFWRRVGWVAAYGIWFALGVLALTHFLERFILWMLFISPLVLAVSDTLLNARTKSYIDRIIAAKGL